MSNVVWINSAPGFRRRRVQSGGRPLSAGEFDPMIERMFARTPTMVDAELFAAEIRNRLEKRSRVRGLALGFAGFIGGCVAVRETMNIGFSTHTEAQTLTQGF